MAAYIIARLVDDTRPAIALSLETRKARAAAAKTWLSSLALPSATRTAFSRLAEATAGDGAGLETALFGVIEVTRGHIDGAARTELEALARVVAG